MSLLLYFSKHSNRLIILLVLIAMSLLFLLSVEKHKSKILNDMLMLERNRYSSISIGNNYKLLYNSSNSEFLRLLSKFKYIDFTVLMCSHYSVDIRLVLSIIYVESRYNELALSNKGAIGLMQVMPINYSGNSSRLYDPIVNIGTGIRILSDLDKYYRTIGIVNENHRILFTVIAYNSGIRISNIDSIGTVPIESNNYANNVLSLMKKIRLSIE